MDCTDQTLSGTDFQIRPIGNHNVPSSSLTIYPTSLDARLRHGDEYRKARQILEDDLSRVNHRSAGQPHTGTELCETCKIKNRLVKEAFYKYYSRLSMEGLQKPEDVERMFREPDQYALSSIHQVFLSHLRQYLIHELCSPRYGDVAELSVHKSEMVQQLGDQSKKLDEILISLLEWHLNARTGSLSFKLQLQETRLSAERVRLYIEYYCSMLPDDTATQRNFKAKYARMFESGLPHDEVVDAMRKEAAHVNEEELRTLRQRLAELQMAQSAHLKNKRKKAERKDRRETDREEYEARMAHCSLGGCENDINKESDETIQCALCDWLASKSQDRKHFYYCTVEHAEEDFDTHDRDAHKCAMYDTQGCFYYPHPGPPGETEAGGICPDCADHGVVSYFCSHECYSHNLETHRDEFHYGRGINNHADLLDVYKPAPGLQIIS